MNIRLEYLLTESFVLIQWPFKFVNIYRTFCFDTMIVCHLCLHFLHLWPHGGTLVFNLLSFRIASIYTTSHTPRAIKMCRQRRTYLWVSLNSQNICLSAYRIFCFDTMTVCHLCLHLLQLWPQGGVLVFESGVSFLEGLELIA